MPSRPGGSYNVRSDDPSGSIPDAKNETLPSGRATRRGKDFEVGGGQHFGPESFGCERAPDKPVHILTVYGFGCQLAAPDP